VQKPFRIKTRRLRRKLKQNGLKNEKNFAVGADICLGFSKVFRKTYIAKMFRVIRLLKF